MLLLSLMPFFKLKHTHKHTLLFLINFNSNRKTFKTKIKPKKLNQKLMIYFFISFFRLRLTFDSKLPTGRTIAVGQRQSIESSLFGDTSTGNRIHSSAPWSKSTFFRAHMEQRRIHWCCSTWRPVLELTIHGKSTGDVTFI